MRRVALPSGGSILITSAPSPASRRPAYSARSSAISTTLNPASMPGPALPIISPGPVDDETGAVPACVAKAFSLQMCPGSPRKRREHSPAGAGPVKETISMLVRRGEHTDLEARAKAEPADSVVTRDYYTQRPQIRLTGDPAPSENPTEITLDGNDVARLVECALRHP